MRLVIGSIMMESNTFSPVKADLEHFKTGYLLFGEEVINYHRSKSTEIGGFIKIAKSAKVELVPSISAWSISSGRITTQAFEFLKNKILQEIDKAKSFDGVLLALHGSMVGENIEDAEGNLLKEIRDVVGKNIPLVATLDLHANTTDLMVKNADGLLGYHTFPHVDFLETGEKAARLIIFMIRKEIKATMAMKRIPMILSSENMQTTRGPMAELIKRVQELEQRKEVVSASVFGVQQWLDIEDVGWSTLVITNNNLNLAKKEADNLARMAWRLKDRFSVKLTPVKEAIEKAMQMEGGPIILNNSADAEGAGAPGDSTIVLRALIEMKVDCPTALTITDSEAVEKAIQIGVGKKLTLRVGGKIDNIFNKPVKVTGRVKLISDGRYIYKGPTLTGVEVDMGRTVVLNIFKNIYLVITEFPAWTIDPEQYRSVGIEPKEMKIVVVKSQNTFKAGYESIAREIIVLDAPGISSSKLTSMPFKHIKRPIYPFDKGFTW